MAKAESARSLEEVRWRIDAIDAELLALLDERAGLAADVAAAKAAAGGPPTFGLRPGREAQVIRGLVERPRKAASAQLIVRLWREIMAANLAAQGHYALTVWSGNDQGRTLQAARQRFGAAPELTAAAKPEDAIAAARKLGGVGVCALTADNPWWGRLLAEPKVKIFAALPDFEAQGPMSALAMAEVEVEPTGNDMTFWVTDAPGKASAIEEALGRDGVAGSILLEAGGLKLFALSAYYQADDPRLKRAPGTLSGVIGAAPVPLDA